MSGNIDKNMRISIIMAAYNHEKYVCDAIQSAIAQSYGNIELLAIDDGSPDGTWEAIESMEQTCRNRFARTVFLRQENQGIWGTLNRLLELAEGEFIMRLDSDDMIKPQSVEKLHAFLTGHAEYGLAVGDNEFIDAEGRRVYWDKYQNNVFSTEQAKWKTFGTYLQDLRHDVDFGGPTFGEYTSLLSGNYIPNGYLVRREALKNVRFTRDAPTEDYYMMFQISKTHKMKFFDEILHSYRWHAANTIKNANRKRYDLLTRRHELGLLKQLAKREKGKYSRALYQSHLTRKKSKLKIGRFFEFYKAIDMMDKERYYMDLFGKSILLKEKHNATIYDNM